MADKFAAAATRPAGRTTSGAGSGDAPERDGRATSRGQEEGCAACGGGRARRRRERGLPRPAGGGRRLRRRARGPEASRGGGGGCSATLDAPPRGATTARCDAQRRCSWRRCPSSARRARSSKHAGRAARPSLTMVWAAPRTASGPSTTRVALRATLREVHSGDSAFVFEETPHTYVGAIQRRRKC